MNFEKYFLINCKMYSFDLYDYRVLKGGIIPDVFSFQYNSEAAGRSLKQPLRRLVSTARKSPVKFQALRDEYWINNANDAG